MRESGIFNFAKLCQKTVGFLVGLVLCLTAHAAEMVNVEYIHKLIKQKWDITINYAPTLENPRVAANMKYLLTTIDVANEILNGEKTTDYGNSEYATMQAADTIASIQAVETLIKKNELKNFTITTTPTTSRFSFTMSAMGNFTVDWGDGKIDTITRTDTTTATYSHTYSTTGEYTITFDGKATGYTPNSYTGAISFCYNSNISKIDGCLGKIFSTIGDGSESGQQPRFDSTFRGCSNLTGSIPEHLFTGVRGAPTKGMFRLTFTSSSGLTGPIPEKLFAGLSGAPAEDMFNCTFDGCRGLTGEIPKNLFAGIKGAPAPHMFPSTFANCSGLTGEIPSGLFAGISGAPATYMFDYTFIGCSNLTSIGANVFGNISGDAANNMFTSTFYGCRSLSGPSARIGEKYLYEIWPNATSSQVGGCYRNTSGLTDYADIPAAWK